MVAIGFTVVSVGVVTTVTCKDYNNRELKGENKPSFVQGGAVIVGHTSGRPVVAEESVVSKTKIFYLMQFRIINNNSNVVCQQKHLILFCF